MGSGRGDGDAEDGKVNRTISIQKIREKQEGSEGTAVTHDFSNVPADPIGRSRMMHVTILSIKGIM